ncbi:MAG: hypothetical protein IJ493_07070 [Clostridia bacterium]|nr:hypothetical protein [Clostridia bacterium]
MAKGYLAKDYNITPTGVRFTTADGSLQALFERCEAKAKENIKRFGDRMVMVEGAKYQGVWLETQPMGGEMYATRNMEVALNNQLIFMQYQRRDGRMAGMITYREPYQGMCVHQDWMQGDFFTRAALRMYWFIGEDRGYLEKLYTALRDFDEYLWNYRDSDGDGCLETWCVWDTGDDNNTKLLANGVKYPEYGACCGEDAPYGHGKLPFESAEYMAYSYSHRMALAEISDILGNGEGDRWREAAKAVQDKVREYLWDDERGAVYDRDCDNQMIYTLTLENIKCMYHGLFTQEMADEFIARHLMNPEEFFTPLPLPNIAANDPLFYVTEEYNNFTPEIREKMGHFLGSSDLADNSWGGPVQGLSMQRSVEGLMNYGHHAEATIIGRKWLESLEKTERIVQQYHPFTGEPAPGADGYGPAILSALEYMTYLYGVDYVKGELIWSCSAEGADSEYTQTLFGHEYTIKRENGMAHLSVDGEERVTVTCGARIVTDMELGVKTLVGMETVPVAMVLGNEQFTLNPNQRVKVVDGKIVEDVSVRFDVK